MGLFLELLSLGDTIIPLFIHNPKTQSIEGVVAVAAKDVVGLIGKMNEQKSAQPVVTPTGPALPKPPA